MAGAGAASTGEPPVAAAPPRGHEPGALAQVRARGRLPRSRRCSSSCVWIVYPAISTIYRSFFDASGDEFVWFDNYEKLFTNDRTLTAIKNNFLWLADRAGVRDGDRPRSSPC